MKIIPVIDVLNGVVVHAVRGRRKEYQPLKSVLCASAEPVAVASALKTCRFGELYLADLDAIMGGQANFPVYRQIADETMLELMVDAGISDVKAAEKVLKSHVSKVVIGTETLRSVDFVSEAIERFGKDKVVVSLDLMGERIISRLELDREDPLALLRLFHDVGVAEVIVLDLARVGSGEGVNLPFLRQVLRDFEFNVFVGGGVRDIKDLVELKKLGVSGVLLATALHSGKISLDELRSAGLL
jgi:phosphoribosylformimino-5-aminoimidazole carboxamide ribotide isomerase